MKILIGGASGFVGRELTKSLTRHGHRVVRLVRRATESVDEIAWDPAAGRLDAEELEGVDAVVNLSGENVGAGRWTARRREAILRSRIDATRTLVGAIQKMKRKPAALVSASATGFYGDRGDEELTEASPIGHGFLPEVCLIWETHAEGAVRAGVRTVLLRFGVVLGGEGGALAKMLPVFRLGLGGRMGDGRQWMSWVAIDDVIGAIEHALANPAVKGPINVTAPQPVTNADFAATLGRVLGRPAFVPAPAFALRLVFGAMADEALLASARVRPERLGRTGYAFRYPTLEPALRSVLGRHS